MTSSLLNIFSHLFLFSKFMPFSLYKVNSDCSVFFYDKIIICLLLLFVNFWHNFSRPIHTTLIIFYVLSSLPEIVENSKPILTHQNIRVSQNKNKIFIECKVAIPQNFMRALSILTAFLKCASILSF